jgi:Dolichyl-phosphate-mannose-protein mannosyltransferase
MPAGGDREWIWRLGVAAACLLALVLQIVAIREQSLIGDAPYHLLAGDQALRYGRNLLNLEHPPLVKLVAALPLLGERPLAPPDETRRPFGYSMRLFDDPGRALRAQYRGRAMLLALFGVPFLFCCYALGRRLGGARTGVVLALCVALSLNILPFLSVVQTDTAASLGFTLLVLCAVCYVRDAGILRALGIGAGLGVAVASKHSGVLLVPTILAAVSLAPRRTVVRRLLDLAAAGALACGIVYGTYAFANRNYDAALGRDTIRAYCSGQQMVVEDRMRPYEQTLLALERVDPILAQWLTGLLGIYTQNQIGIYLPYAFGRIDSRGQWWFFPAVLACTTPVALLLASAASALAWWRRRAARVAFPPSTGRIAAVIACTIAVYMGVAMSSSYNLSVRHLMPILPLLYLPAALWAGVSRLRAAALVGVLALEAVLLAPLWMSATNTWWLGSYNPTRFSLFATQEYRQNFIALARAARQLEIEKLHVVYPLIDRRIVETYVPESVLVGPDVPLEPGWYAVNVRVETYIPALLQAPPDRVYNYASTVAIAKQWEPCWRALQRGEDHGYVAGTFHLYRLREDQTGPRPSDGHSPSANLQPRQM